MSDFIPFCQQLSTLSHEAIEDLSAGLYHKSFKKNELLLKSGEVCQKIYFLESGLVKTGFNKDGKEFIMRFFPERSMFTVLDSYIRRQPSTFSIMALEPTNVTYITETELTKLCKKHHSIETFFRGLVSQASLNMMKRISEMLEEDATTRYLHFVTDNKSLLQRISLGDLASYLGITQVSLSRIRAKK